jgi:hypothetical protein
MTRSAAVTQPLLRHLTRRVRSVRVIQRRWRRWRIELPRRATVNAGSRRTKRCDGSDTGAMSDLWDETDDGDVSPICTTCGVSALPPEVPGEPSLCENPNCSEFGEPMSR